MASEVTVFATCLVDVVRPDLLDTTYRLVEQTAGTVRGARGATCCGQPAWNSGFPDEARRVARPTLRALARSDGPVVVPSGSCATMMSHGWPALFENTRDEGGARSVARRVVELTEYLAHRPDSGETAVEVRTTASGEQIADDHTADDHTADSNRPADAITLHDSCHLLRERGVKEAPRQLLRAAGHALVEAPGAERCCGFGGTFSVKMPGVSAAMADDKLDDFVATGASTVAGCDLSCLIHLEGRAQRRSLPLRFEHVADLLAVRAQR